MTLQLWSCSKFLVRILHQHLFGQFLMTVQVRLSLMTAHFSLKRYNMNRKHGAV